MGLTFSKILVLFALVTPLVATAIICYTEQPIRQNVHIISAVT